MLKCTSLLPFMSGLVALLLVAAPVSAEDPVLREILKRLEKAERRIGELEVQNKKLREENKVHVSTGSANAGVAPAVAGENTRSISTTPAAAQIPDTLANVPKKKEWYERFGVRGYTQFRSTYLGDDDKVKWYHPADRTVAPDQSFTIRRGRIIFSGDATDHLFVYVQPELNGSPSDGDFSTQLRDLYFDISFDEKKEYRVRIGQSKVPFGFVNMQSSQNRLAMERPDAINSAAEGERDIGAFLYWAPTEIRERFGSLVRDGLKGSGDYGVFALGAYNGQGLNRSDSNSNQHLISRVSYPFKFESGQIFEPGLQAYTGKFVPRTSEITIGDSEETTTPTFNSEGIRDERAGVTAVLYPQPFGIEAEWNVGRGPELSSDFSTIKESSLQGGYIMANYRIKTPSGGDLFPFVRWQYYDGGRKFGRNAPSVNVNEFDFGLEYSPWKEVEVSGMYTYTADRTNSNSYPYGTLKDESRVAVQVQVNY